MVKLLIELCFSNNSIKKVKAKEGFKKILLLLKNIFCSVRTDKCILCLAKTLLSFKIYREIYLFYYVKNVILKHNLGIFNFIIIIIILSERPLLDVGLPKGLPSKPILCHAQPSRSHALNKIVAPSFWKKKVTSLICNKIKFFIWDLIYSFRLAANMVSHARSIHTINIVELS